MVARAAHLVNELMAHDEPYIDLSIWLQNKLMTKGLSDLEANEQVGLLLDRVQRAIERSIEKSKSRGIVPLYDWLDEDRTHLVHMAHGLSREERFRRAALARHREQIHDEISRLTGEEFERLSLFILDSYDIPRTRRGITQRSGDGGLDFYAYQEPTQEPENRLRELGVRFVGQSKLSFGRVVHPDDLASFAMRVGLCREERGKGWEHLPAWFRNLPAPIIGLFVTGGRLGPDSIEFAREHVIIYVEGDQVSEDLARAAGRLGWVDEVTGQFRPDAFHAAIEHARGEAGEVQRLDP